MSLPVTLATFTASAVFDPSGDAETFLKSVPPKGAVYLFTDEEDRPVQLLSVGNLRQSLKRRLCGDEQLGPSKRVNYRDLVRRVYWRRVDSRFEADWIYLEAARSIFPDTYQGMVGFRATWFVHVNPDAAFPRYTKTTDLTIRTGQLLGPFEDKHAAARWVQLVEDAFDLCRYYNVLVEAPRGKACAYKEMGRCPAPCDGSIGMDQYRGLIQWSSRVAVSPAATVDEQTTRMKAAAGDLRFESAGRIKTYVDELAAFAKGPFRFVRPLSDFRYVALQRGPKPGTAKMYLIRPGELTEIAGLIAEPLRASDLSRYILAASAAPSSPMDPVSAEQLGVVAHHLFGVKKSAGFFLHVSELDDRSLAKAFRELSKQKVDEADDGEGLLKELQSL